MTAPFISGVGHLDLAVHVDAVIHHAGVPRDVRHLRVAEHEPQAADAVDVEVGSLVLSVNAAVGVSLRL